MRYILVGLFIGLLAAPLSQARGQSSELCEGLLDEVLIAVDRGNAAVDRGDRDSAVETFFWVEEAAGALELSCRDHLPSDVLAWLADTRLSALVQVGQWDLAVDRAEECAERYGELGYCWLRGAEAMRALDRPQGVERFLEGYDKNKSPLLPAVLDELAIELRRWINRRGEDAAPALPTLGRSSHLLLQRLLDAGGFEPGTPDGIIGPQTIEALERFYADREDDPPAIPFTLLSFSGILFDFEPLLRSDPVVVAALEPARSEIEPFYEAPDRLKQGAGVLIGRDGEILTALSLVEGCARIEARIDLPRLEIFPVAARLVVRDAERGFALLSSNLRTGYWARFAPEESGAAAPGATPEVTEAAMEGEGEDASTGGLLLSGYPLQEPLSRHFAARYAGGPLRSLEEELEPKWLGAPVLNARGHLTALVTGAAGDGDGAEGRALGLRRAPQLADALLDDAVEVTSGRQSDPILSPADQARLAQLMTVKIDCYAD